MQRAANIMMAWVAAVATLAAGSFVPCLASDPAIIEIDQLASRVRGATVCIRATLYDVEQFKRDLKPTIYDAVFGPRVRSWSLPERSEAGSGFVISDNGYIVTNYHLVASPKEIRVSPSGHDEAYPAEVVGFNVEADVALLKIEARRQLPFLTLGDSDVVRPGDQVLVAAGNTAEGENTFTKAIVSEVGKKDWVWGADFVVGDFMKIEKEGELRECPGGNPVLDRHGDVVGIYTAYSSTTPNVGFAVPSRIAAYVVEHVRKGTVPSERFGVTFAAKIPSEMSAARRGREEGALVERVDENRPAARAGLAKDDLIIHIDGERVRSSYHVVRAIARKEPGSEVQLTILRDGKKRKLHASVDHQGGGE